MKRFNGNTNSIIWIWSGNKMHIMSIFFLIVSLPVNLAPIYVVYVSDQWKKKKRLLIKTKMQVLSSKIYTICNVPKKSLDFIGIIIILNYTINIKYKKHDLSNYYKRRDAHAIEIWSHYQIMPLYHVYVAWVMVWYFGKYLKHQLYDLRS